MSFFGLLIPSPMATVRRPMHRGIDQAHDWSGWPIALLAAGHALAALYHHFVPHDGVLRRILGSEKTPHPQRSSVDVNYTTK